VEHALAVTVDQRVEKLAGPDQHFRLCQLSFARDAVGQVLSFDELHYQVDVAAFFEKVADADQVGMVEVCHDGGFLLELLVQLG